MTINDKINVEIKTLVSRVRLLETSIASQRAALITLATDGSVTDIMTFGGGYIEQISKYQHEIYVCMEKREMLEYIQNEIDTE